MSHTLIPHSSRTQRKVKEQPPPEEASTELEELEKEFAKQYETGSATTKLEESYMDIDEYPEQHKEHLENIHKLLEKDPKLKEEIKKT